MLIVFAQLLTVDRSTVCRHTRNTRVTKDVETMVTTTADDGLALRRPCSANNHRRHQPRTREAQHRVALSPASPPLQSSTTTYFFHHCRTSTTSTLHFGRYIPPDADPPWSQLTRASACRRLTPSSRVPANPGDESPERRVFDGGSSTVSRGEARYPSEQPASLRITRDPRLSARRSRQWPE